MILDIPTARVFLPLLEPSRYKGAWGGRGSGKSSFFADQAVQAAATRNVDIVCLREVQQTLDESVKKLLEDKIELFGLSERFDVQHNRIIGPFGNRIIFMGMKDQNAHSIKSLEGYGIAWFEEAQAMSHRSLELLRPTIREPGSELWFSWNPDTEDRAIEQFLRGPNGPPPDAIVVESNWRDNPWFPPELEAERLLDLKMFPKRYLHIWDGEFGQDGDPFFLEESMLVDGCTIKAPERCDSVYAVIDTAVKDGLEHDGTAVVYFAKDRRANQLIILDWDVIQIEGYLLESWLPGVYLRLDDLAKLVGARYGSAGTWIEDKSTGSVLIQHARNRGMQVEAIDSGLTALGKEARAISASPYVFRGQVKLSAHAHNKITSYRGITRNHLLSQVCGFRLGVKTPHTYDLFDSFVYGVMLGLGDADGF